MTMPEFFRNRLGKPHGQVSELSALKRQIAVSKRSSLQQLAINYVGTHSPQQAKEIVARLGSEAASSGERAFIHFVKGAIVGPKSKYYRAIRQSPFGKSHGLRIWGKTPEDISTARDFGRPSPYAKRIRVAFEESAKLDAQKKSVLPEVQKTEQDNKRRTLAMARETKVKEQDRLTLALLPVFRELARHETPRPIAEGNDERLARKREFLREMGLLERNAQHPS